MRVRTYEDITVELLSHTWRPEWLVKKALGLTTGVFPRRRGFLEAVWDMGHESVFEHVVFSFLIRGLSRNAVMQLTRHRLCSFTISSQHYRGQEGTEMSFSRKALHLHGKLLRSHAEKSLALYALLREDLPKEEARQVLPGAAVSDLVWTVNARELALFLRLRLCRRNIEEMCLLAEKIFAATSRIFPLVRHMAKLDCETGKCRQGKMRCRRGKK